MRARSFRRGSNAVAVVAFAGVCAAMAAQPPAESAPALIAILPIDNMTGRVLDGAPVAEALRAALAERDVPLLDDARLRALMDAHRVRYTGGLDPELAAAFRKEAAVTGVLITSVERWEPTETPALALTSRLVSTETRPRILWVDDRGITGEDRPGFLDLGVVTDPDVLLDRATRGLADSLAASLSHSAGATRHAQGRFKPRKSYRNPEGLAASTPVRVAILPFTNRSPRRHAGELLALHFARQFAVRDEVEVVEPGVVRDILLRVRMIPEGGIAFSQADLLKELLGADLLLTGDVLDYIDTSGEGQVPIVDFMAQLLDCDRRSVVWSSFHHNSGADRVWFFDQGRIRIAGALASAMAQTTVDEMLSETHTTRKSHAQ